ncbi:glucosamine-6-phosphate deaminase [Wukongibacter baidiensis]|uniref:glucosamine-6-phosphate deaminase n=1 Tax=Wukongibacter baidiensis TaxID=1723361 RepID=UPI003D7F943E
MKINVVDNYEEMSKEAARLVAAQIRLKPESIVGFATGSTPTGMYKELVKMYREEGLDFSKIVSFNLDEYYPIDPSSEQSYYFYMMNNLFNHINIEKDNINIPDGKAPDVEVQCRQYEERIRRVGGIDLQVLGIGPNGHIGFNEPDLKFEAETHIIDLDKKTIEANSRFFNSVDEVPKRAITMGIKTIMHARKIVLLANGSGKAEVIKEAILGSIVPNLPASILQLHQDVTIICDKEASKELI